MTTSVAPRQLERLESQLTALRNGAIRFEQSFAETRPCAFCQGIIGRMDEHYVKRRATLRKLSVATL
jgi:tRNA U54 and U55 pseudouridine synthase Pus10